MGRKKVEKTIATARIANEAEVNRRMRKGRRIPTRKRLAHLPKPRTQSLTKSRGKGPGQTVGESRPLLVGVRAYSYKLYFCKVTLCRPRTTIQLSLY